MDVSSPIFWHHGLFLQPQHFQIAEQHEAARHTPFYQFLTPHFWGVCDIEIRHELLTTGSFGISSGEFIFPDGTYLRFPGNAVLASRSFLSAWPEGPGPFAIYLGLRKWNPVVENVSIAEDITTTDVKTRFVAPSTDDEAVDLYTGGPEAQIRQMKHVLRLIWETEEQELNEYEIIPIAQLERVGKEARLSPHFIPPCVSCAGCPELVKMLRQINDMVASRCRLFEEQKPRRGMKSASFSSTELLQIMGMQSLSEAVPRLAILTAAADIHPWTLYLELAGLIGRLSTFSDYVFASGENASGEKLLPAYDHRNLHGCFNAGQRLLSILLDEVILGTENVVRLTSAGEGIFSGALPPEMIAQQGAYFLLVRTASGADWVRDAFLTVVKLASGSRIADIRNRFVSGVQINEVPYPPQGVPRLADAVYFYVQTHSPEWLEVLREGTVSLYWDSAPDDLQVEIALQKAE